MMAALPVAFRSASHLARFSRRATADRATATSTSSATAAVAARFFSTPSPDESRDVVVIGSGPGGYTAALYAARALLNPLVLAGVSHGGQLMLTSDVENFPGYIEPVPGPQVRTWVVRLSLPPPTFTTSYQLPATSYQLPATSYQLPATSYSLRRPMALYDFRRLLVTPDEPSLSQYPLPVYQ